MVTWGDLRPGHCFVSRRNGACYLLVGTTMNHNFSNDWTISSDWPLGHWIDLCYFVVDAETKVIHFWTDTRWSSLDVVDVGGTVAIDE